MMMVISAIMLLSMVALEFVFGSNVNYRIAVNEKERLQAHYLAESALNLMKVELKMDKQIKSAIASSPIAQGLPIDLSQPMCQQFPFSTELIRAFFIGGEIPLMGGTEGDVKAEGEKKEDSSATVFEAETAQEFLSFEGDFNGECKNEESKFNLNYFANLDPAQESLSGLNQYDAYKFILTNFLKADRYKKLFEDPGKIEDAVRNIADWTDKNDVINTPGGTSQGAEVSLYKDEKAPRPRNTKFLSLDEVHLVDGVKDTWFMPLEDMFTIYGGNKINICMAEDDVIWALIIAYAGQKPDLPPIDSKNADLKKKFVDTVRFSCTGVQPQTSKIASDLDTALGIGGTGQTSGGFASLITTENRYYSLKLTGQVGNTVVNIKTVLDTKDQDPKKWKMLYYKVY